MPLVSIEEQARRLSEARKSQGLSIAELASKVALSPAQLRALEKGDSRPFYNPTFHEQAATRYARALNVDLRQVTESINSQPAPSAEPDPPEPPKPAEQALAEVQSAEGSKRPRAWPRIAAVTISLLLAFAGLGYALIDLPKAPSNPTITQSNATTEAPPANPPLSEPAKSNPKASTGTLQFTEPSWVQVVLRTGEKQNLRVSASEPLEFKPEATAALAFGKPDRAKLTIHGREIPLQPHIQPSDPSRALVIIQDLLN
jgi:cytoskeletal protein RodZ